MRTETSLNSLHRSLGTGKEPVLRGQRAMDFAFSVELFARLRARPGRRPRPGAVRPRVARRLARPPRCRESRAAVGDARGALRWRGGCGGRAGPAAARGSGARGSPPAAPGRRAYGVSKVTLRTATFSGGGGHAYEPFGDLRRRAPGERPPRAPRFRRRVPGRADGGPRGATCAPAELGGLLRHGFRLHLKPRAGRRGETGRRVRLPTSGEPDVQPGRRDECRGRPGARPTMTAGARGRGAASGGRRPRHSVSQKRLDSQVAGSLHVSVSP